MSDTPLTDKARFATGYSDHGLDVVDSDFARSLERNQTALLAALRDVTREAQAVVENSAGFHEALTLTILRASVVVEAIERGKKL